MVHGKFSILNIQNILTFLSEGARLCFYTLDDLCYLNTAGATTIFAEEIF